MAEDSLDQLLRESLDDGRLLSSESRRIDEFLERHPSDEESLAFYRHRAFVIAREHADKMDAPALVDWLEKVVKRLVPRERESHVAEAWFSSVDNCSQRISELIDSSRSSIEICVFTITDDRISDPLLRAHRRGVDIRILTDDEKACDRGSDIHRFQRDGLNVRMDHSRYHMHHKFAIFDRRLLLTGSYNWTRGAAEHNVENFVVLDSQRLIHAFSKEFERLWRHWESSRK